VTESASPELRALRERAARRKSPWNLVLLVFAVAGVAGSWIGSALLFRAYRQSLVPPDAFLSGGTRFGNILMYVPPGLPSIALGLVVANLLIWCIAPARVALNYEAKGSPGTDFRSSNAGLFKLLILLAIITLPMAFAGARNFWLLTPHNVTYQPMLTTQPRQLKWSDVRAVRTGCYVRRIVEHNFVLQMQDGTNIDLAEETPLEFLAAYPAIQKALAGANYEFSNSGVVGQCRLSSTWARVLLERPTND